MHDAGVGRPALRARGAERERIADVLGGSGRFGHARVETRRLRLHFDGDRLGQHARRTLRAARDRRILRRHVRGRETRDQYRAARPVNRHAA